MGRVKNTKVPCSLQSITGDMSTAAGTIGTVAAGGGTVVGSLYCNSFAGQTALQFLTSSSGDSWRFNIESTTGKPFIWTTNTFAAGTTNPIGGSPVPYRQWFRFAITQQISGGNVTGKIYIDGQLVASATATRDVAPDNYFRVTSTSSYQKSMFAVYERVLSDKEIFDDANNPLSIPGAKLCFRMDEGSGVILYDSASGNNATGATPTYSSNTPYNTRKLVDENLIYNGDFSFIPKTNVALTTNNRWLDGTSTGSLTNDLFGWNAGFSGTCSSMYDTTELFNGMPSLKVSTLAITSYIEMRLKAPWTGYGTLINQGFALEPSTQYTLTYMMKSNVTSGDSNNGAYLTIMGANGVGNQVASYNGTFVKTTTGWTKYTLNFTTSADIRRGHLQTRIYGHTGAGTLIMDAWFADIKLVRTAPITRSTAQRTAVKNYRGSLYMTGSNNYANAGSVFNSAINSSQAYTVRTLVRRTKILDVQSQRFMGQSGSDKFWFNIMAAGGQEIRIYHSDLTPTSNTTSYTLRDYSWHELTATFAAGVSKIFVDGVLKSTTAMSGTLALNNTNFYIAGSLGNEFYGFQSHSAIWSRALSDQEVLDMYLTKICPKDSLLGEYLLEDGSGSVAKDSSGRGNDATIVNATFSPESPSKKRQPLFGNLIWNGDLSYYPANSVAQTTNGWMDGTAAGAGNGTQCPNPFKMHSSGGGSWTTQIVQEDGYSCAKLSTTAVSSNIELRFGSNSYFGNKYDYIRLKPSTRYRATFWMKTNYVSGDSSHGASIYIGQGDGAFGGVTGAQSTSIKTTTPWTKYTVDFTTGATIRFAVAQVRLYGHTGTGTLIMDAWFRDLQLIEVIN